MAKKSTGESSGGEQLKRDLHTGELARFYVIYGEEDYLCRFYLEQLKKKLLDELTAEFNYHHLTQESFDVQALADAVESLPMMADRSLVHLEDIDLFNLDEESRNRVTQILKDLPPECCLVLTCQEFKPDKRKKKLWDAIEANAVLAEFNYQTESALRAWLIRHFRANKKSIDAPLCGYLLQQCGQSMTRLHAEVEKICAYSEADTIVKADIDAVVEPTLEAVVFEITDALAQRKFDIALEKLRTMLKLRAEPIPVLAAIGNQLRRLNAAKVLLSHGKAPSDLTALCGVPSFAAGKTMTQAQRFSEGFCRKAVLLCAETDYAMKTSGGEPERLLELLILQLAEEARRD